MNKASIFFGGILPIGAFTFIDEYYGPVWGTVAGMLFGIGEVVFEYYKYKKVSLITWITNGLILALGGISIFTQDGFWFKMQPAIFEFAFAAFLFSTFFTKKNLFLLMAEKQGQKIPELIQPYLKYFTFRLGFFIFLHSILATWAALRWSTTAWALLKGVGFTVSLVIYFAIEMLWIRKKLRAIQK